MKGCNECGSTDVLDTVALSTADTLDARHAIGGVGYRCGDCGSLFIFVLAARPRASVVVGKPAISGAAKRRHRKRV